MENEIFEIIKKSRYPINERQLFNRFPNCTGIEWMESFDSLIRSNRLDWFRRYGPESPLLYIAKK